MEKEFKLVPNELELILNKSDVLLNGLKNNFRLKNLRALNGVELKSTLQHLIQNYSKISLILCWTSMLMIL